MRISLTVCIIYTARVTPLSVAIAQDRGGSGENSECDLSPWEMAYETCFCLQGNGDIATFKFYWLIAMLYGDAHHQSTFSHSDTCGFKPNTAIGRPERVHYTYSKVTHARMKVRKACTSP